MEATEDQRSVDRSRLVMSWSPSGGSIWTATSCLTKLSAGKSQDCCTDQEATDFVAGIVRPSIYRDGVKRFVAVEKLWFGNRAKSRKDAE